MQKVFFADAHSDYERSSYVICGVPFDGTSCFRKGSRLAPREIRKASYNFETYNDLFDIDLDDINIYDAGDLEVAQTVDETLGMIQVHADRFVSDGKIPVMLGGEHSLTLPFVRSCKKQYPDLAVVVLDAHLDLRPDYEGERNSHACVSRNIIEGVTKKYVSIGTRSGSREEYKYARENKIKIFSSEDIYRTGIEPVISEIRGLIKGPVYLSIDMDAIDPAYAPGLGTPEPYGLSPRDVREVIACLSPDIVGFDVVEIAPEYDAGITAILGARFVRDFIAASARTF